MATGLRRFIHILPTLNSNARLLSDFEKQLSLLVDLTQDRSDAQRQPIIVIFRPSGRPKDEFVDVVQSYIDTRFRYQQDDLLLITVFNNTKAHHFFLEEMKQTFKVVDALIMSNGYLDVTSNKITFDNLKHILIRDFNFKEAFECSSDGSTATQGEDLSFKARLASDGPVQPGSSSVLESTSIQPKAVSQQKVEEHLCGSISSTAEQFDIGFQETKLETEIPYLQTTEDDEIKQKYCDSSQNTDFQQGTNMKTKLECKQASEMFSSVPPQITFPQATGDGLRNEEQRYLLQEKYCALKQEGILEGKNESSSGVVMCAGIDSAFATQIAPVRNKSEMVKQQTQETPELFMIEGCRDKENFPETFTTKTVHDELREMRNGNESLQKGLEKKFKLQPGCLLDILIEINKELNSDKEKASGNSDIVMLSSDTLRKMEIRFELQPGKLVTILLAILKQENEKKNCALKQEGILEEKNESSSGVVMSAGIDSAYATQITPVRNKSEMVKQQTQETPELFMIEGCRDRNNFPETFTTKTVHDELREMRNGNESLQKGLEEKFKLQPGCLLDIVMELNKELNSDKEKTSGNSDIAMLSSETLRKMETRLELKPGKLVTILLAILKPENEKKTKCQLM